MFAYCANNPVKHIDESGNWAVLATKCIISAVTSVACDLMKGADTGEIDLNGEIVLNAVVAVAGTIVEPFGTFMTVVDIACSTVTAIQKTGDPVYGIFVAGLGAWAYFATGENLGKLFGFQNMDDAAECFMDATIGLVSNLTYSSGAAAPPDEYTTQTRPTRNSKPKGNNTPRRANNNPLQQSLLY